MDAPCRHPARARDCVRDGKKLELLRWFCAICGKPDLVAPRRVTVKG